MRVGRSLLETILGVAVKRSQAAVPMIFMLVVVCLDAVGTVSIAAFLADANPLTFGGSLTLGVAVAVALYLVIRQRSLLAPSMLRRLAGLHAGSTTEARLARRELLLGSLARLDWPLFVLAAALIAPAIASIIFLGLWPILFILLLHHLTQAAGEGQYHRIRPGAFSLLAVGAIGLALVVLSQSGPGEIVSSSWWAVGAGAVLALTAVSFGALGAFHYSWGRRLALQMQDAPGGGGVPNQQRDLAANLTMLAFLAANLAALPVLIVLGAVSSIASPGSTTLAGLLTAAVIGAAVVAPEGIFTRLANLRTSSLTINAISYLSPAAAVVLFSVVGRTVGVDSGLLTIGTSGIVAVNLLLNFDPEAPLKADGQVQLSARHTRRNGFKALILALWCSGTVIYFRRHILDAVDVERHDWGDAEYWGLVALSSTVFILILSFRQQRLADRIQAEQRQAISLFRRAEYLVEREVLGDRTLLDKMLVIAAERESTKVFDAYIDVMRALRCARRACTDERIEHELVQAELELDELVHSKQDGWEFTELVALAVFGLMTVAIVLLARPDLDGWSAVLVDVFGMIFVSGLCFLFFALIDSVYARNAKVLELHAAGRGDAAPERIGTEPAVQQRQARRTENAADEPADEHPDEYVVTRRDESGRAERVVALLIGAAMLAVYCLLFYDKWIGDPGIEVVGQACCL